MYTKKVLSTIMISMGIMLVLMGLIYDFHISLINISNVLFFMGVFYFFPGLIVVSGAGSIFDSAGYLTRRMFFRNSFKSLNEYKEYKHIKNVNGGMKGRGANILVIGGAYIVISIAMGIMI